MIIVGLFAIACGEMKIGIAKDSHPNLFLLRPKHQSYIHIFIHILHTYIYIDR